MGGSAVSAGMGGVVPSPALSGGTSGTAGFAQAGNANGGVGGSLVGRCGPPLPVEPTPAPDATFACQNGNVSLFERCSEWPDTGYRGWLDDAPAWFVPSHDAMDPGTMTVSRRACGNGPLTYTFTFFFDGERAGDMLTVHANASEDCLIQGVYLPRGGDGVTVSMMLSLQVWEPLGHDVPSVLRGYLVVTAGTEARSLTMDGGFTVVTDVEPCVT